MKKAILILCILIALLICALTAAGAFVAAKFSDRFDEMTDYFEKMNEVPEVVTTEDDVTIAGIYVIKSTKNISDAYISKDRENLTDREKETLDLAASVLDGIITDGMSDYEKELAVYEWMTENLKRDEGLLVVIPQTSEDCDNPYGVLKYHNAVCVGYATTFRLFMQMLGIDCMVVHNTEQYHSWDLVKLGDGWYHTDIYSDVGMTNYSHFNRTDYMQSMDQSWDKNFFPSSSNYEYCYVYRNSDEETDVFNIPARLRATFDEGGSFLGLRFPSTITEYDARVAESIMQSVVSLMNDSKEYADMSLEWQWLPVEDGFILSIHVCDFGSGEPEEITPETYEKIDSAIFGAFGDIDGSYYLY